MNASTVLIVLLMMGAESTRNMYSNLAEKKKYNCLKLHHVGYLIKRIDDARNHKYKKNQLTTAYLLPSSFSRPFAISHIIASIYLFLPFSPTDFIPFSNSYS
jgi:hypothetical protein